MEEQDQIGQLFENAFNRHQLPLESGEWEVLSKTLQKHNFFHFNVFQFNIYYASTIVFCFMVCLGVGSHYTYSHIIRPHHPIRMEVAPNTDHIETRDMPIPTSLDDRHEDLKIETKTLGDSREKAANPLFGRVSNSSKVVDKNIQTNKERNTTLHPDSVVHFQATKEDRKTDSVKTKPKRTLYITKQDTVFEYDTLRAPKRKKRWFK